MYSSVTNTEPRGAATENGWATTDISLSQDICELSSVHETPVLNKTGSATAKQASTTWRLRKGSDRLYA